LQANLSLANGLIAALPAAGRALLLAQSELVELSLHDEVLQVGQLLTHAWFPVEGFVSVSLPVAGRRSVEVALVGSEGMFATSLVLGVTRSAFSCRVQGAGRAYRMTQPTLMRQLEQDPLLRCLLQRYVDLRYRQLSQQAACTQQHRVEQRLARCLLMARDRVQSRELFLTHEVLALMLGARRESVTQAASQLQQRGLISYSRGYVMLLDEAALLQRVCPCYEADLQSYGYALGSARVGEHERPYPPCSQRLAPGHAGASSLLGLN